MRHETNVLTIDDEYSQDFLALSMIVKSGMLEALQEAPGTETTLIEGTLLVSF